MTREFLLTLAEQGYSVRSYSKRAIFINYGDYKIPTAFASQKKVLEYIKEVKA